MFFLGILIFESIFFPARYYPKYFSGKVPKSRGQTDDLTLLGSWSCLKS